MEHHFNSKVCFRRMRTDLNFCFTKLSQLHREYISMLLLTYYHRSLVRNLGQSCDTIIVSLVPRFLLLSWCSISHLIRVKRFKVTLLSLCHVTYINCNFQQMKLSMSMTYRQYVFSDIMFISVFPWSFVND